MACVPGSPFMANWYHHFMKINEFATIDDYVRSIQSQTDTSGIEDPHYLTMHIAALHTLQHAPSEYRLTLLSAEDGPFLWLHHLSWSYLYLIPFILYFRGKEAPVVKYRSPERTIVQTCQLSYLYD